MDEELERFKRDVNLIELATARGYEIDRRKSSRASVVMRHPTTDDKIVIARSVPDQHWTYFSVRDGRDNGTVVDFLLHRDAPSIASVREELRGWVGGNVPDARSSAPRPTIIVSPKDRAAVAAIFFGAQLVDNHPYLNARGIRPETLLSPRFRGTFRRDHRGSILFPHADSEGLSGFEEKNHGWTRFSTGGSKGLWTSNAQETDTRLVIVESAINAISYDSSRRIPARATPAPRERSASINALFWQPP
jgi:hypothetical protein